MKKINSTINHLVSLNELQEKVNEKSVDGQVFLITTDFLIALLEAFLKGSATADEIADYAEFMDANDDIDFQNDEVCPDIVFRMSSPEINGRMTAERAVVLLEELRAASKEQSARKPA